ncbi:MAG: hypothetical protein DI529_12890 [Chryseobacterium sp.]|nr:MAG: hypothetical protein DI529_12890 [Chryseobacterium sp.]
MSFPFLKILIVLFFNFDKTKLSRIGAKPVAQISGRIAQNYGSTCDLHFKIKSEENSSDLLNHK